MSACEDVPLALGLLRYGRRLGQHVPRSDALRAALGQHQYLPNVHGGFGPEANHVEPRGQTPSF